MFSYRLISYLDIISPDLSLSLQFPLPMSLSDFTELSLGVDFHFDPIEFPSLDELRKLALERIETATTKTDDLYYTRYTKGFLEDSILCAVALGD